MSRIARKARKARPDPARRESRELAALREAFLSALSHELRTPLTLIRGYAEFLQDAHPGDPWVEGVLAGSRQLSEHFEAILDFVALERATLKLRPCVTDLAEPIGILAGSGETLCHARGQCFVAEPPTVPLPVAIDVRRFLQTGAALLDNAAKFTPRGGEVGLCGRRRGAMAELEVWDNGPGLPAEVAARLGEGFFRPARGDAAEAGGLGLGLAIAARLVRLHHGRLGWAPRPGGGSRFLVRLPLAYAQ